MSLKQYRSKMIKWIAIMYLTFPLGYLGLTAVLFDLPMEGILEVSVSPFFWLISVWAMSVGYGFWEMKRWAWYLFLFTNSLIAYESTLILVNYGETHHKLLSLAFLLFLIGFMIWLVGREIRVPYFLPRIRWWESNTRFQLSVPVKMFVKSKKEKFGKIVDLSIGGCYVKTPESFEEQEKISLEFRVFGQTLSVVGIVVWKSRESVTRPQGIGVKFTEIEKEESNRLRVALKRIKRVSAFYRKMPDETDQEYLAQAFEDEPESESNKE